jgi:hypothetical protein
VGKVAYQLDLLDDSRIHPIVRVSQLKKHVPATTVVSDDLSSVCQDLAQELQPHRVVKVRTVYRGAHAVPQSMIQWYGLPDAMATWEDEHVLHQKFPKFIA